MGVQVPGLAPPLWILEVNGKANPTHTVPSPRGFRSASR